MSSFLSASGEVTEVGRTPHVPLVDDRARRDRPRQERKDPHPPPRPPDDEPLPPAPPGKIDILARA